MEEVMVSSETNDLLWKKFLPAQFHATVIRFVTKLSCLIWCHLTASFKSFKSRVYVKSQKYFLNSENLCVIDEIDAKLCGRVIKNFVERERMCQYCHGIICLVLCSTLNYRSILYTKLTYLFFLIKDLIKQFNFGYFTGHFIFT